MKKLLALLLAVAMVLSLAACGGSKNDTADNSEPVIEENTSSETTEPTDATEPTETGDEGGYEGYVSELVDGAYARGDDEEIYNSIYGEFSALMEEARSAESNDDRFVLEAKAEAVLLDTATMIPNTTQGGAYTLSLVAPRTIPYVQWGNDDDRWHGMVISDEPGLYMADRGIGIRIEDDLLITNDGCEVLTKNIVKEVEDIETIEEAPMSNKELMKKNIIDSLKRNNGNRKKTAQELDISERTLYRKIKDYGLEI